MRQAGKGVWVITHLCLFLPGPLRAESEKPGVFSAVTQPGEGVEPEKELRDQRPFTPSPLTLTPLDRNVLLQSKKNVGLTLLTLFTSCPWCPLPLATTSQRPLSLPSPPAPKFPNLKMKHRRGLEGVLVRRGGQRGGNLQKVRPS